MESPMGATPNFGTNEASNSVNTGSGTTGLTGNTGSPGNSSQTSPNDDVSFSRGGMGTNARTTDGASSVRNAIDTGKEKAQDTFGQLQQKASEMTARIVDNINVDDITQKLEAQVREHPARTLLLAVGAGFLLGRTLSSSSSGNK